jgi:GT2 family glycosyltransferase
LAEDLDLSWRIKLIGYQLKINCQTKVYHKGGSTFKAISQRANNRYLSERNTIRNLLKNYSTTSLMQITIPYIIIWWAAILFFLVTFQSKMAIADLKAMGWNLFHLKKTIAKRKKIQQIRVLSDKSLQSFFVPGSEKVRLFVKSLFKG